ncbi:hypothetical protein [Nocardia nova]|uniref:hypothetical protein n=1 Tax=Nocardia nova TaxID=37330 RepID=UPI0033F5AF12
MMNNQATERNTKQFYQPGAIGLVRVEVSASAAPRHAEAVARRARALGYRYLYTVRPPHDIIDPIGYALDIATGLEVAAIVVYDLAHVDNQPARVCDDFDLETVCPAETWARAACPAPTRSEEPAKEPATIVTPPQVCARADIPLAHKLMRDHRECRTDRCVWKAAAFHTLVDTGRLAPQTTPPRARAATRGIPFPPLDSAPHTDAGPTPRTLREVLDKLSGIALPERPNTPTGHTTVRTGHE